MSDERGARKAEGSDCSVSRKRGCNRAVLRLNKVEIFLYLHPFEVACNVEVSSV